MSLKAKSKKSGAKPAKSTKKSSGGVVSKLGGALVGGLTGGSSGGGGHRKRNRGPQYWANKVIVEKLKQKYRKLRFGSVR